MKDTQIHNQIIPKNSTLPILGNAAVRNGLMWSTDLDVEVQTKTDLEDGLYRLAGGKWVPSDPALDTEDFPPPTEVKGPAITFRLDPIAAKRLIACTSADETRFILCCVLFRVHEDGITMVSTDGSRLTACEWPTMEVVAAESQGDYIVPHGGKKNKHPLNMLMKDRKRDMIEMTLGDRLVSFDNGEQVIMVKCVEGKYPNYKQVIPATDEGMFYVDQEVMVEALKEVRPYTYNSGKHPAGGCASCPVEIFLEEDSIRIHAKDIGRAPEHEVVVPAKHVFTSTPKMESIALDVVFLLDSFMQEEGVVYVGYHDNLSPVVIGTDAGSRQVRRSDITVQMPMRIT